MKILYFDMDNVLVDFPALAVGLVALDGDTVFRAFSGEDFVDPM